MIQKPLQTVSKCEVCGAKQLKPVLNLGQHPMCDDLVPVGEDRQCIEYPIKIGYCESCRTAHQIFQIPKENLFPITYHYRSRHTADVLRGMRGLVNKVIERLGPQSGRKVLDIGCNDGSLLGFFRQTGAKTFGIEPTGAFEDAVKDGHLVVNDYLNEDVAESFIAKHGHPDVITFTNVFAHIENLDSVLRSLLVLKGKQTAIVIENHYLGKVIFGRQFDTFYHEHPRTYSYTSFVYIAERLGMYIDLAEFPSRYGGNIRVILRSGSAGVGHHRYDEMNAIEGSFTGDIMKLSRDIETWRTIKLNQIMKAVTQHGPLVAKAFPGRAAIPVKMLGLSTEHLRATYEKPASGKIGHFIPGTRIPILSDSTLLQDKTHESPIINLAWHIPDEIRSYMREAGYSGDYIDIISADDFI